MKFSPAPVRPILVCERCQGRAGMFPVTCSFCRGMVAGTFERGRWLYFGETHSQEKILAHTIERAIQRILLYSALIGWGLSWVYAGIIFFSLFREPHASEYSLVELFHADYRVALALALGVVAAGFALYERVRLRPSTAPVEQFDYQKPTSSFVQTAPQSWSDAEHLPRKMRVAIAPAFTPEARQALDRGYLKAGVVGNQRFLLNHLLYGLFDAPVISSMLLRLGLSTTQLKDLLIPSTTPVAAARTEPGYDPVIWQCLFEAYAKAYAAHQTYVGAPELFLAVIERSPEIQDWFFGMGVDADMLINVVAWIRVRERLSRFYKQLAHAAWLRPRTGLDKAMTAVATPLLNQCSEDVTLLAQFGHTESCVARDKEFEELLRIIAHGERPALIIADHGIGKKTLVNGLAERMVQDDVPPRLRDKRLVRLSVAAVVAGTTPAGAVERLIIIMNEIARAGNIVLCIDNLHELVGISAGAGQSLDVGSALASALSRGRFVVIGTCTPEAYSQVIATTNLSSLFVPLKLAEMDDNQAIQALESKIGLLEYQHRVFYSYSAIAKAVELAKRFLREQYLPGSARQLLTEAGAVASSRGDHGFVTAETVAGVVAEKTSIPVTAVASDESTRLLKLEQILHERVIGQEEAVSLVANALRRARAEIRAKNRPIANFLFLGPTGVGKTELTKTIAQVYFGGEERMVRLDMSEYQDKSSIHRLIGSPGQKGSGILTEAVRRAPFSLVLLDELEKADKDILNLFLQVMDDGRLSDSTGRVVDFTNTIIIATSNAGTAFVADKLAEGLSTDAIKDRLIHGELRSYFRPEFLNRFDGIVLFKPLEPLHIRQIARLMLKRVTQDLEARGVHFVVTDEGIDYIASVGFDPEFGARPLRRAIEEHVENRLAELVLSGELGRRSTVLLREEGRLEIV